MPQPSPASHPFLAALDRHADGLELVERAMREQLTATSELVPLLGAHVLDSGGKRMRPALLLMAAELCGYRGPRRIQIAAAVELLHTATLLHDDVVDCSELRRGRPSANAMWGNRRAVLGGDFLYSRASAMVVEDGNQDILWLFANTIRAMAEGELLQLERSFDPDVTEAHYFSVIDHKSATLLSAACEAGAILSDVTRGERRRLADFGRQLGLAFQLRDDALDYEAGEAELGKPRLADLREGKVTLPLLLTLKRCAPAEREEIASILKRARSLAERHAETEASPEDPLDVSPALGLVEHHRGVIDAIRRAERHAARAAAAIAPFPDSQAKRDLLAAAGFAVERHR